MFNCVDCGGSYPDYYVDSHFPRNVCYDCASYVLYGDHRRQWPTERDELALYLLAFGWTHGQIAGLLHVSTKTIQRLLRTCKLSTIDRVADLLPPVNEVCETQYTYGMHKVRRGKIKDKYEGNNNELV